MILLLILIVVLIASIALKYTVSEWSGWDAVAVMGMIVSGFTLSCAVIIIPINRYEVRADIHVMNSFQETVDNARKQNLDPLERAAILQDIAKWNQKIAKLKYDNAHIWDLWIPDEVEDLEPIK